MEAGCVLLLLLPFKHGRKEAHPTPTLLPLLIFFWRKIWATCPRGTQSALIHSHLFSLAAISKASFYAQKWFVQAGPSKQLWQRPASLLWGEMTDNTGMVRGWKGTWLQFIWSENIFFVIHWYPLMQQNTNKQAVLSPWDSTDTISFQVCSVTFFNYHSHLLCRAVVGHS